MVIIGDMIGIVCVLIVLFSGFVEIIGVILGICVCVVIRFGVVVRLEVVNGGYGGFVRSGIGWVRFWICCFFCRRFVCKVFILLVKVVRLGFVEFKCIRYMCRFGFFKGIIKGLKIIKVKGEVICNL